jgi:hypothetical protein
MNKQKRYNNLQIVIKINEKKLKQRNGNNNYSKQINNAFLFSAF